jgi:sulfur-oxidizing protein SoxY
MSFMTEATRKSAVLDRRQFLAATGAAAVFGAAFGPGAAFASADDVTGKIKELTGGAQLSEGKINIDLPQIAENGNTVPLTVSVDSPMTDQDHVQTVHVFADGNPAPEVVSFHFTPMSGKAECSARMRLAKTQNVVAVAQMSDGKVYRAQKKIKVTIGGCGG